jgi:hypothetical protein
MRFRLTPVISGLLGLCACGDQTPTPTGPVASTETGLRWNHLADVLTTRRTVYATRLFTYLHLAQFRAAEAAVAGGGPHPPVAAAIGGASVAAVLSHAFPSERDRLAEVAEEASLSRLYAGIHYRFDMTVGLALGRAAAARALAADLDEVAGLP